MSSAYYQCHLLSHIHLVFASQKMNRPDNAFYNFDQNAATAPSSNDNTDADFAGPIQKLEMTNPMAPSNNIPAMYNPAMMAGTAMWQPATGKKSKGHATTGTDTSTTNQVDVPMPRRNLSSYNLFFQVERENIIKGEEGMNYSHENIARVALRHYQQGKMEQPRRKHRKTHGKISFAELARTVANRWKQIDPSIKEMFILRTNIEKARYQEEIAEWADRKLRSKPSPKREAQPDSSTLINAFTPNDGVNGRNRFICQGDAMMPPEFIMPHRVFPPTTTTTTQLEHSLPVTQGYSNTTLHLNNARYVDMYSQFTGNPGMGFADPNNLYDFNQQYLSSTTSGNDFAAQMQQYPQLNLQPIPNSMAMTLQQQFDVMTERRGFSVPQAQSSAQVYHSSFSMRSPSTIQEQFSAQRGDGYALMPTENYTPNEAFQQSSQHQQAFGTLSNQGGMQMTEQAPMRHEAKLDDNETLDLQSLFNRYDAN